MATYIIQHSGLSHSHEVAACGIRDGAGRPLLVLCSQELYEPLSPSGNRERPPVASLAQCRALRGQESMNLLKCIQHLPLVFLSWRSHQGDLGWAWSYDASAS